MAGGPRFKGNQPHTEEGWGERWDPPKDNYWGDLASRMPRDAKKLNNQEQNDEVRWGAKQSVNLNVNALGTFASPILPQFVYANRPARVWSLDFAFAITSPPDVPDPAHNFVRAAFNILLGTGSTRIQKYVTLDNTQLVAFFGQPPIASTTLVNVPAREIMISPFVEWRSDGTAPPGPVTIQLFASVAPVFR